MNDVPNEEVVGSARKNTPDKEADESVQKAVSLTAPAVSSVRKLKSKVMNWLAAIVTPVCRMADPSVSDDPGGLGLKAMIDPAATPRNVSRPAILL